MKVIIKNAGIVKKPRLGVIAKKVRSNRSNLICIAFLIIAYAILFFFLRNKLLFTPDFGESDAYHINISLKYFLAENLKQGTLPFWTDKLQGGFPLFAESQIGALFLPNIIFLRFFDFADGYNLLLIFSLFCMSVGFFLLLRQFKISPLIALLFSLIFTFNGTISLRWVHLNLIQTFSLAPYLFYLSIKIVNTKNKIYLIAYPFVLSQMIFAGFIQVAIIPLFGLFLFYPVYLYYYLNIKNKLKVLKYLILLLFLTFSGFVLSLSQLLPTFILAQNSSRVMQGSYEFATMFSFAYKSFIKFIDPYYLGNPTTGGYPPFSETRTTYWEDTPYLGIFFFIILLTSILFSFRKKLNKFIIISFLIILFFIILSLGKNSLLFFLFYLFPFNLFRCPTRYMLIVNFILILITSILFNNMYQNFKKLYIKIVFLFFIILSVTQLIRFTFEYHLFIDKNKALEAPLMSQYIDNSSSSIIFGQVEEWNKIFINRGWEKPKDVENYLFFKNYIFPNSNLIINKKNYYINTGGLKMRNPSAIMDLIGSNVATTKNNLIINDNTIFLFKIVGIKNIFTQYKINNKNLELSKTVRNNGYLINLYKLKNFGDAFFYIPEKLTKINYNFEFEDYYNNNNLSAQNSIIENIQDGEIKNNKNYKIINQRYKDNSYELNGKFEKETYIVFRENYYPEWELTIDNKKVKPLKINLAHIGVLVPKGKHNIVLKYENKYFKYGLTISMLYLLFFFLIIKNIKSKL